MGRLKFCALPGVKSRAKSTDLTQSFENIANELRHQYNVFYRPEPLSADGLYHAVDIRVKGRKDLIVRARHGYYAPKF